jgi:hypothetical protein
VEKEYLHGHQGIVIKGNIKMMNETAMEKWSGLMAAIMWESGLKGFSMDMGKWYSLMKASKKVILKIISILDLYQEVKCYFYNNNNNNKFQRRKKLRNLNK